MAASGYTPISLYYSSTPTQAPSGSNLVYGELAINIYDGKLYYKDSSNVVKVIAGTGGTGVVAGSNTQVQFNNNGVFGASSAFTWDGTTLSATKFAGALNGTVGATTPTTGVFTQVDITGQGDLRLQDTTGGEYVALQAPTSLTASYTLTLPIDDGTNGQALITDGSGNLSWSSAASGDVYGPASATDNAMVRFDGTTGKIIKNSGVIVDNSNNMSGVGTFTASGDSSFTSTGALQISKGTTGQQPGSPFTGMMRYNTTTNQFEGYSGASPAWKSIGGSALSNDTSTASNLYPVFAAATTGTAENLYTSNAKYLYKPSTGDLQSSQVVAGNGFFVNSQTISVDYTVSSGNNAMSAGPVTVDSGVVVTVSSGSVWTVV
jgi:hypothetical protein